MILTLSVRLAATAHAYLDAYAPTNVLIRTLRGPGRQRLALPVAAVLAIVYGLFGAWLTSIIDSGGPAWFNPIAFLCAWNTIKFACVAVASAAISARRAIARPVAVSSAGGTPGRIAFGLCQMHFPCSVTSRPPRSRSLSRRRLLPATGRLTYSAKRSTPVAWSRWPNVRARFRPLPDGAWRRCGL